ncbi:2-hydroxy-3-oxopropionate [Cyphellophora attinorum]|uniref:3-hydroxyisobutyrate dehydrogenase n=1 Tax=Cyphellophora attinorum TaxID=1664694 RepID=A0A0N1HWW0_9EURO|nr:2-hydroxy-3-oxopropionate [Phialophora attinorum]KPI42260.1 2-hydroxy-3-oxopropionate [Phialophora attinorum]
MTLTVGYIGLGKAGASMASNIPRAGFKLIVRDADPERERSFASANPGTTIAEAGPSGFKDVDVLVTMLPQGKVVREVMLGSDGIAQGLKKDAIVIDTSSSSPYDTMSLGADLKVQGLVLIDSPVTQAHLHDTDTGDATFMVGCDDQAAFDRALPVLQSMAKYVFHMGKLGAGHAMKTLNNYVSAASIVALSDALVTGQKIGLDPVQMIDVLNVGTGRNFSTTDSYQSDALPRKYASGFQLALLIKDVGIAKSVFEHEGFETEMPGLVNRYFQDAMDTLKPDADHTELLKRWEQRAGIELKTGQPCGGTVTAMKK